MFVFDMIRHGPEDVEDKLTTEGLDVVAVFATKVEKDYDFLLSSPYKRCIQTAQLIEKFCIANLEVTPWLCTRHPNEWNTLLYSPLFASSLPIIGSKLETVRQLASGLVLKDANLALLKIIELAQKSNYHGKVLAVSHNVLISTTAGLFRTNSIFDREFDGLPELSGARITINESGYTSERLIAP